MSGQRIDKWLWCVRLFRSRSLATAACLAGKVKIEQESVKPARLVRPGDTLSAVTGDLTRTVRVKALLERRVSAPEVTDFLDDLTPPGEIERMRADRKLVPIRPAGAGRPTKRERRQLAGWHDGANDAAPGDNGW